MLAISVEIILVMGMGWVLIIALFERAILMTRIHHCKVLLKRLFRELEETGAKIVRE